MIIPNPHAQPIDAIVESLASDVSLRLNSRTACKTAAFTCIVLIEKANVLKFQSLTAPLHRIGFLSNPWVWVWATVVLTIGLLTRLFLGSTSRYVLLHAKCSVMIVRDKHDRQTARQQAAQQRSTLIPNVT